MQKIINDPDAFVDEFLEGILLAHPNALRVAGDPRAIVRHDAPISGKVGIVTGGGSGHLPVFGGYVGPGLADGVAFGNVFAAPSSDVVYEVTKAVNGGSGVLHLFGNYGGDILNFDIAAEQAMEEGIEVSRVLAADDVASASAEEADQRRGIAGISLLYKVAGARADEGASLQQVVETTLKAASGLRTAGVALSSCTVPSAGRPTFDLPVGQMEIGMGIHGEPGIRRGDLQTADEIADQLLDVIFEDLNPSSGQDVAVLVNGLGATPPEELYLLYRRTHQRLADEGLTARVAWVGEYATSLEMAGASISLMRLDDELERLLEAPAHSHFLVKV